MSARVQLDSTRSRLRVATVLAALLAVSAGIMAGRRHDTRMDDAQDALVKAAALIEAADCATDGKNQRDCERSLGKTLSAIEDARTSLSAAMVAADGGL